MVDELKHGLLAIVQTFSIDEVYERSKTVVFGASYECVSVCIWGGETERWHGTARQRVDDTW